MKFFEWLKRLPKKRAVGEGQGVSYPVPKGFLRGVPTFEDLPTSLENGAYDIIWSVDTVFMPAYKRAQKCGSFYPVVVGGREDRREAIQAVLDASVGLPQAQEFLSYADYEGVRFLWLRARPVGRMNVIDARGQGERKVKAGGNFWWGGPAADNVVFVPPKNAPTEREYSLDTSRVVCFTPSAEANPEGDSRLGLSALHIAILTKLLDKAVYVYTERHSLPKEIVEVIARNFDPVSLSAALSTSVGDIAAMRAMDVLATDSERALKIIETNGKTWQFLMELRIQLNGRGHKLATGENLTSDSAGAGDAGSSELADKQFFSKAAYIMQQMAEEWTSKIIPFIDYVNAHWIEPAAEDDPPMWIEFRAPVEKQRLKPAELLQAADRDTPILWEEYYGTLGLTMPPGVKERFGPYYLKSQMPGFADKGLMDFSEESVPLTDSGNVQRKDRREDANMRLSRNEDIRNADKEDDEEEVE